MRTITLMKEARFAKQTAQREALLARGKKVEWKVVPKSVVEPEEQIETIVSNINRVSAKFQADIENAGSFDAEKRCDEIIEFFKSKASQVVYKLTKAIFDNASAIAAENAKGNELSIENAVSGMAAPFHAGAAKYFAEKGATVNVG